MSSTELAHTMAEPRTIEGRRGFKRNQKPIHFGEHVDGTEVAWVAMSKGWLTIMASNPTETTDNRVMALAHLRMSYEGVAVFKRSELSRLVQVVDRSTGEFKAIKSASLNKAIERLIERGHLEEGSWSQVLYVPLWAAQNGQYRDKTPAIPERPTAPRPQNLRQAPGRVIEHTG